jgi:hypothetical protein
MPPVLDRFFVHRLRMVTGKDCNPLNEVEVICESLMNDGGVLHESKVIKFVPAQTVTKLAVGEPDFVELSSAIFAELERRFVVAEACGERSDAAAARRRSPDSAVSDQYVRSARRRAGRSPGPNPRPTAPAAARRWGTWRPGSRSCRPSTPSMTRRADG